MLHHGRASAGRTEAGQGGGGPIEQKEDLLSRMESLSGSKKHLLELLQPGDQHLLCPRVLELAQRWDGLLEDNREVSRRGELDQHLELLLQRRIGRTGDPPEQRDQVPLVEALRIFARIGEGGHQPLECRPSSGSAVHFQQREEQVAAVAPRLAVQVVQEPLRREGLEETQDLPQQRMLFRLLRELAQALWIEQAVFAPADRFDQRIVDLLLGDDPLRQVEHRDGLSQRPLVELLDGGHHHLVEPLRPLLRVLRHRHDPVHGLDRSGRQGGRRIHDSFRDSQAPARQAAPQHADDLIDA